MGAQQNSPDGLQQQSLLVEMEGHQVVTAQLHMHIHQVLFQDLYLLFNQFLQKFGMQGKQIGGPRLRTSTRLRLMVVSVNVIFVRGTPGTVPDPGIPR